VLAEVARVEAYLMLGFRTLKFDTDRGPPVHNDAAADRAADFQNDNPE
jgi:hypothetical protein